MFPYFDYNSFKLNILEQEKEKMDDFLIALKTLLKNGEKEAALLLIEKVFPE